MKRSKKPIDVPEPLPQLPVSGAVVGYARVSTEDQNLDMQLQALSRVQTLMANGQFKVGCDRIHKEKVSAVAVNRPELEKALLLLREGDTFVVWKLDRLARSMSELLHRWDYITSCGASLRSLTEQIDTTSAVGRFMFHILGALAEFERGLIQERIASGMQAAKDRGVRLGAEPMFDKATAKLICADRRGGMSYAEIAIKYDCSKGTARNYTRGVAPKKRK